MATSVLPSPIRMRPMDRCDLSPAKRIAFRDRRASQNKRPSVVDVVDIESSTSLMIGEEESESLISLLRNVPQKQPSPNLKRFQMYPTLVEVYSSLKSDQPLPAHTAKVLEDRATKRRVYQDLFEIMHHRSVIEELLIESSFYSKHFDLHSHRLLMHVMTYDFLKERFTLRLPRDDVDNIPAEVVKVGQALWQHKVKLNATLSRMRVKDNAQSLTELIPDLMTRQRYQASLKHPCYARVNLNKVKDLQEEVFTILKSEGYTKVSNRELFQQQKMAVRHLHKDLLEFSSDCRGTLDCIDLVKDHHIILQDIESYNLVEGMRSYLESFTGDVILTHANAGLEAVHIASILGGSGTVFAFDVDKHLRSLLKENVTALGLNNIQFIHSSFSLTSPDDDHLGKVKMVVCLPPASLTRVSNPVDFVIQEEDLHLNSILKECDRVPPTANSPHTNEQMECLHHALTFTHADRIVYATRSHQEAENGVIVRTVLEQCRSSSEIKIPLFHLRRSAEHNLEEPNYYVALLETRPIHYEENGPKPQDVIQKAIAKGILDGSGISTKTHITSQSHSINKLKKKTSKTTKTLRVFSRHDGIPMTIAAQKKIVQKKDQTGPKKVFR